MKICYICTDPGVPVFGRKGCSTHVRETCLTLISQDHDVRLICANTEGDDAARDRIPLVEVQPYHSKKLGFDLRRALLDRRLRRATLKLFKSWRPDAIYERYSLYSATGTALALRFNLPHLLEVNAFMTQEQSDRIKALPLARLYERRIFSRARHVVVVSQPLREELAAYRHEGDHVSLMPMAVDLKRFHPDVSGAEVRSRLGLDGRFVIGYVGTLTGWHGITLLYDLARRLRDSEIGPFKILVVGGDDKRVTANRQKVADQGLEDSLYFHGPVPHDEVPSYIRAMDAALVPDTTYWSSPAKLFEYQGCGIPVLAPRYPAIEKAMEHEVEGWVFEPRDIEQIAQGALALQADPESRRQMGARARERAEREHSWESLGQDVAKIFESQREELGPPKFD